MPLSIEEKVLAEMYRVTKNKGKLIIVDYGLPKNAFYRFLLYHIVALFEGGTYKDFVSSDLKTILKKINICVIDETPEVLSAARILKSIACKDN